MGISQLDGQVDTVIVLPHWGTQYTHTPEQIQRDVAARFAEAAADLVIGGHPHWVQGWEAIGDTTVVHSLGNFIFDMDFNREMQKGVFVEDGIVTATERSEMSHAAEMLGLSARDVEEALAEARRDTAPRAMTSGLKLAPGDRVVFTGEMERPRSEWGECLAREAGLSLGGVTKTTAVVVAADPNSLSGKAAKARTYGIPIVTESAFETLFDALIRGA